MDIEWKEGSKRDNAEDIRRYTVDYTLYWQGLIQKQGWTKLRMTYNANLGTITEQVIVETTGTTKAEAEGVVFNIGVIFGRAAMEALLNSK